ncbi:MAG: hypothetical protein AB4911_12625 [Oscillochloridaceae bacterium umkhey_bin13]
MTRRIFSDSAEQVELILPEDLATIEETAAILICSEEHVRSLIARGELETLYKGTLRRVLLVSIADYQKRSRSGRRAS